MPDLAVIDVAFISLRKVFPPVLFSLLPPKEGQVIALIKPPQFETGGQGLNKHGVISAASTHIKFIPPPTKRSAGHGGFRLENFSFSPIAGSKGNLEFLAHFTARVPGRDIGDDAVDVISNAWEQVER